LSDSNFIPKAAVMHLPAVFNAVPFPVRFKPYVVAGWRASQSEMHEDFGPPHFTETDSTRTSGGDEDCWAWELPIGQKVMIVLGVPYDRVTLYCDPPDSRPALDVLEIDREVETCEPFLHPSYTGPR
jgi:hypothetical protein